MEKIEFQPAEREQVTPLIGICGPSGSGKTLSALKLARGMVGEGKIALIDTENKRSRFYAEIEEFDVIDLEPPFAPMRFHACIEAAEQAGYSALIIDTISHEWEGPGGCIEMADAIEDRTGKPGLHCWKAPKLEHKKLMMRVQQCKIPIIFTLRAQEKVEQRRQGGKTQLINIGFQPNAEKNFMYEMTSSVMLSPETHFPNIVKPLPNMVKAWPVGGAITQETGKAIAEWAGQGAIADAETERLKGIASGIAENGLAALEEYWNGLDKGDKAVLKPHMGTIKTAATEADKLNKQAPIEEEGF